MATSVHKLFQDTVAVRGDRIAAQVKEDGIWRDVSWRDVQGLATKAATALLQLGVQPRQMVSILSNTRLEWCIADLGILGAGATTVPIYQSSTSAEIEYIVNDAGAVVLFVEDDAQLAKVRSVRHRLPTVRMVVAFTGRAHGHGELAWDEFLELGEQHAARRESDLQQRARTLAAGDILTLIYTSGTTGPPKGAAITHDNMLYESEAIQQIGLISSEDVQYLFLPLAHVFAKVLEVTWLRTGHTMAFWERDMKKIVENLAEVRPTVVCGVPRVFEKIYAKVVEEIRATPGTAGKAARWALEQEVRAANAEQRGERPGLAWAVARGLVFRKLQRRLSARFGGRLGFFISGGAPLARDIACFFKHAGIRICEGYGLTESSAASCVNRPHNIRIGTVGAPLPGTEIRIAPDGEILMRGRGIMKGYHNRPDATAAIIDGDGWLHTGDVGRLDDEGFLHITDRKKDIIITAGGKNVAPQNIENQLKASSALISHAVVHGDQRKFLSVLITVDEEALFRWARDNGVPGDYVSITQSERLHAEITAVIDSLNGNLASYETLKKFTILDHDFAVGDQLTPSLKVKRKLCNERYKQLFDRFYAEAESAVAAGAGPRQPVGI